jgi:hypothetical protein
MRFTSILTALLSSSVVFSAPTPNKSNYELLVEAISEFEETSPYSFALITAALSQAKSLLNAFSPTGLGNLTLFVPSDDGFIDLNLASFSQNDIYTYLQCNQSLFLTCF